MLLTADKSLTGNFIKIDAPGTEYKVVDGEPWLRSKMQIMGYLNASRKAKRNAVDFMQDSVCLLQDIGQGDRVAGG